MATTTPSVTPRLRMTRHSPAPYDQTNQTAFTSEPGPSRLPDFSQLVNVSLKDMDMSDDNIYASDEPTTPQAPAPPTVTRSDNPAAVLRALLSRLPAREPSPTPSHDNSQHDPSERESDYDMETASATTSVAQSSLKNIFSKALREPGDTPQKTRRRNSDEFEGSVRAEADVSDVNGKRRSMSDDEVENATNASPRPRTRFKMAPQPLTQDFLRERFSKLHESPASAKIAKPQPSDHDSSSDTILHDLNSSQATPPAATSTPQQSLRMSFNSQFQSNLLEQDSEMQHVIQALDSSVGDFSDRSMSPPPTLRAHSEASSERPSSSGHNVTMSTGINVGRSTQLRPQPTPRQDHSEASITNSRTPNPSRLRAHSSHGSLGRASMTPSPPTSQNGVRPGSAHSLSHTHTRSPNGLTHHRSSSSLRVGSPSASGHSHPPHYEDDEDPDVQHEKERNWNAPRPVWHEGLHPESHLHPSHRSSLNHSHSSSSLRPGSTSPTASRHDHDHHPHSAHLASHSRASPIPPSLKHSHSSLSLRSASPSSSTHSHDWHHDEPSEVLHEKERNWNAPRPLRHDHDDHSHSHSSQRPASWHHNHSSPSIRALSPAFGAHLDHNHHEASTSHSTSSKRLSSVSHHSNGRERSSSLRNVARPDQNGSSVSQAHISSRSLSPIPPEQPSPTPSRTSSLRAIDNTYQEHDQSNRHSGRSPSPLLSFSKGKKDLKDVSSTSSSHLKSHSHIGTPASKRTTTPTHSPRHTVTSPRNGSHANGTKAGLSPNSDRHSPLQTKVVEPPSQSSWSAKALERPSISRDRSNSASRVQQREPETDDMRETDFSSQSETPRAGSAEPSEVSDSHTELSQPAVFARPDSPPRSVVPQTPRILIQDRTPPDDAFPDSLGSPLTPPRRSTPKSAKLEFKTPSPPKTLPDLPTPSSSDESSPDSPVKLLKTPRLGSQSSSRWAQTPKPPGGWLATPKPPTAGHQRELETNFDERTDDDINDHDESPYPKTPSRPPVENGALLGVKTPKPPGGWLSTPTPAPPAAMQSDDSSTPVAEDSYPRQGLLTPVASLSKGSTLELKTPGVPGGWMNTPAPRRSVLKVRFDSETPSAKEDSGAYAQVDSSSSEVHEADLQVEAQSSSQQEDSRSQLPPSPRSPRKPKVTNIRVLDAFGREQDTTPPVPAPASKPQDVNGSINGFRVLDAMGRAMKEEGISTEEVSKFSEDSVAPTRSELLIKIRRGLDDLAGDFGDTDGDDDIFAPDRTRIEELEATSRRSRAVRDKLYDASNSRASVVFAGPDIHADSKTVESNRRWYIGMALVQLFLLVLMYRLSAIRAREIFLNHYYDPFNPELHLYLFKADNSFHLSHMDMDTPSISWSEALRRGGGTAWYTWWRFTGNLWLYLGQLWNKGVQTQSAVWVPT